MRERESLFNEYLIEVRKREKEEKSQRREQVRIIYYILGCYPWNKRYKKEYKFITYTFKISFLYHLLHWKLRYLIRNKVICFAVSDYILSKNITIQSSYYFKDLACKNYFLYLCYACLLQLYITRACIIPCIMCCLYCYILDKNIANIGT